MVNNVSKLYGKYYNWRIVLDITLLVYADAFKYDGYCCCELRVQIRDLMVEVFCIEK